MVLRRVRGEIMNTKTKRELVEFIKQVQELAIGVIHMVGQERVGALFIQGEDLKEALEHDETIIELS